MWARGWGGSERPGSASHSPSWLHALQKNDLASLQRVRGCRAQVLCLQGAL